MRGMIRRDLECNLSQTTAMKPNVYAQWDTY